MTETVTDAPAPKKGASKADANTQAPTTFTQADIDAAVQAAVATALASKVAGTAPGYNDPTVRKGTSEQNGFQVTDR